MDDRRSPWESHRAAKTQTPFNKHKIFTIDDCQQQLRWPQQLLPTMSMPSTDHLLTVNKSCSCGACTVVALVLGQPDQGEQRARVEKAISAWVKKKRIVSMELDRRACR